MSEDWSSRERCSVGMVQLVLNAMCSLQHNAILHEGVRAHHMILFAQCEPAGKVGADGKNDIQGAYAQPWGALPLLELVLNDVVVEKVVCLRSEPGGPKIDDERIFSWQLLELCNLRSCSFQEVHVPAKHFNLSGCLVWRDLELFAFTYDTGAQIGRHSGNETCSKEVMRPANTLDVVSWEACKHRGSVV